MRMLDKEKVGGVGQELCHPYLFSCQPRPPAPVGPEGEELAHLGGMSMCTGAEGWEKGRMASQLEQPSAVIMEFVVPREIRLTLNAKEGSRYAS